MNHLYFRRISVYENIGLKVLLSECWWKAEIERLQLELDSRCKQQQSSALNGCDKPTDSGDRLTHERTDGGTESRQLISTLKGQLQQAALAQQTANMQLDAIKQVTAVVKLLSSSSMFVLVYTYI